MSQSETLVWSLCKENTTQIIEQNHNQQNKTNSLLNSSTLEWNHTKIEQEKV